MKLIERRQYLDLLESVSETPDIKVITGVRRSGKSRLMEAFAEKLRVKYPNANIIYIDLAGLEFEKLKEYHELNSYVEEHRQADKKNFLFIDEIQECKKFELTINSFHASGKYDIYITGSNSFLLNSDLATLFTGRTFSIKIYPFSFAEYMQYFGLSEQYGAFRDYVLDGGMAGAYFYPDRAAKDSYLNDVFETLVIRDVQQKYNIRNLPLLERLSNYLIDNISNLNSSRRIADVLSREYEKTNDVTISSYIGFLCSAFAFCKVRRYDIKGRRWLASNEKYYLCDHAFRRARIGAKNSDFGRLYENIIAIELLRRGYEIYAGTLYGKEIDFVALKQDERLYIQSAQNIDDESTFKREVTPLLQIKDAYPKILLARTLSPMYDHEGIKVIDIADWLLNETKKQL